MAEILIIKDPNVENGGNIKNKKEKKKVNLYASCKDYFVEYTSNTSLHGLCYVGEQNRPLFEKLWWIIMIGLSLAGCVFMIYNLYVKWEESPVIVSFGESSTSVWQVPFPAVTICSETKSRQTVYNFTDNYHRIDNLTSDEMKKFQTVSIVCNNYVMTSGELTTDNEAIEFLNQIAPALNETLLYCLWRGIITNCTDLFTEILTEEGLCYTFNMLNAQEFFKGEVLNHYQYMNHNTFSEGWTLDDGYPENIPFETFPKRGSNDFFADSQGSGAISGLTVVLKANKDDLDYICRGPVQGFKVSLHTPVEFPIVSQQYFRISFGHEVVATIKPSMMKTSPNLKDYSPKRRQCFFPSERKLEFFSVYTQKNCELECLSRFMNIFCGCVTFSLPRDNSTEICSTGSIKCATDARDELVTRRIKTSLKNVPYIDLNIEELSTDEEMVQYIDNELNKIAYTCNCLQACSAIGYDVEISQADYDSRKVYESYKKNMDDNEIIARMVLYFKETEFIPSKRSELYGVTDFIANCGGLLGLCLGFSLLSLVEIIYFLTIRACCNIARKFTRKNSIPVHDTKTE